MSTSTQEMHFLFKGHLILPRGFLCLFCSLQKQDTLQHRGGIWKFWSPFVFHTANTSFPYPCIPSHLRALP